MLLGVQEDWGIRACLGGRLCRGGAWPPIGPRGCVWGVGGACPPVTMHCAEQSPCQAGLVIGADILAALQARRASHMALDRGFGVDLKLYEHGLYVRGPELVLQHITEYMADDGKPVALEALCINQGAKRV